MDQFWGIISNLVELSLEAHIINDQSDKNSLAVVVGHISGIGLNNLWFDGIRVSIIQARSIQ